MKKIARRRAEFASVKEMLTEQAALHGDQVVFSYRNKPSDEEKVKITLEDLLEDVRELGTELISMAYLQLDTHLSFYAFHRFCNCTS